METNQTPEEKTTVKVGFSQLKNPTPKWMANTANGIIFAGMAWAMICGSLSGIPENVKADITQYMMLGSGLIKLATKFFGLDIPKAE